jgi:hypothetical protein
VPLGVGIVPKGLDHEGCVGGGNWHIAKSHWAICRSCAPARNWAPTKQLAFSGAGMAPLLDIGNSATDMRQVLVLDCIVFILSLIPVLAFLLLMRKSIVSYLDLQMKKKLSWFFLQYGQISCVSNEFLVGSVI